MKSLLCLTLLAIICTVFAGVCKPKCKPFEDDCNFCDCTEDGELICTKIACTEKPPEQVCKPGSTFQVDCNTCVCSDDGTVAGCTKIGCPTTTSSPYI